MFLNSHLLKDVAFSSMLPGGIIALGLILNTMLGLIMGRIRSDKLFNLAAHSKLSLALIILFLGIFMGFLFQDDLFSSFVRALCGLIFFVIPYFLLLAAYALIKRLRGKQFGKGLGLATIIGCACAGSLLLFLDVGREINLWKIDSTEIMSPVRYLF